MPPSRARAPPSRPASLRPSEPPPRPARRLPRLHRSRRDRPRRPKPFLTIKPTYRQDSLTDKPAKRSTGCEPPQPIPMARPGSQSPEPALTPGIRPATPDPLGTPAPDSARRNRPGDGNPPGWRDRPGVCRADSGWRDRPGRLRTDPAASAVPPGWLGPTRRWRPTRLADGARLSGRSELPAPSRQWGRTRPLRWIPMTGRALLPLGRTGLGGADPTAGAAARLVGPAPAGGAGSGWRRSRLGW